MARFTTLFQAFARVPRRGGMPLYLPTEHLPPGTQIEVETRDMRNERYSDLLKDQDRGGLLILTAAQSFYLIALESWPSFVSVGLGRVLNGTVCKLMHGNLSPEATFCANVSQKDQTYTIETGTIATLDVDFEGERYTFEEKR